MSFDGLGPLLGAEFSWRDAQNVGYVGAGSGSDPVDPYGLVDLFAGHAQALRLQMQAEARRKPAARETRLYWSGRPDPVMRQILRAYGVTPRQLGLAQRSAFSPEYRRRQRARVKRRRR